MGVDHSEALIKAARRHNSGPKVEFAAASIAEFESGSNFDLVFMVGVLHHLDQRPVVMARIRQLLRPGGYLAVNEPQPSNRLVSFARRIRASLDGSYSDDQDEISPGEMHRLFSAAGFNEIQITPQGLFSTPFAEVPMRPDFLAGPAARLACIADSSMESRFAGIIRPLSWNLSAIGRRPQVVDPNNQKMAGRET
jgi:SAM-dependent methyltransferase